MVTTNMGIITILITTIRGITDMRGITVHITHTPHTGGTTVHTMDTGDTAGTTVHTMDPGDTGDTGYPTVHTMGPGDPWDQTVHIMGPGDPGDPGDPEDQTVHIMGPGDPGESAESLGALLPLLAVRVWDKAWDKTIPKIERGLRKILYPLLNLPVPAGFEPTFSP